jgi:hypothetical protein
MNDFVVRLIGQTIYTLTGRPNEILDVKDGVAIVGTNRSPEGQPVDLSDVQDAADQLYATGEVVIDVEVVGHRSAFVGAVLALLPGVIADTRPYRIRLAA